MDKKQNHFSLNSDIYKNELYKNILKMFEPVCAIHYSFTLPFQLPFIDGSRFEMIYNNHAIFFYFDKFSDNSREVLNEEDGVDIPKLRTRIEILVISNEDEKNFDDEYLYSYFINILEKLNNYIYAYRLLFEDWKTKKLSSENLHCSIMTSVYSLPKWNEVKSDPLMINTNYENILLNSTEEYIDVIESFGMYLNTRENPFITSHKFFAESRYFLFNGHYQESIIYAQMCIESFLNSIYRMIRLSQGKQTSEIDKEFDDISFMKRIKKTIHIELGGNWELEKGNKEVHSWYSEVYLLRNRIVHGGYTVLQHEAYKAFTCTYDFCKFLDLRVKCNNKKFPKIVQYLELLPGFFLEGEELKMDTNEVD